jgi:fatty-acyl-CoA synthase
MPVVPMFHVMAWGLPHAVTAAGGKHVYPGPSPSPADIASLIEEEGVTFTAGVPTVWLGLLDYLEDHDADLSSLERIAIGGAAAPKSLIRTYEEEYDVQVLHAWGMTETSPVAAAAHLKPGMESWPAADRDAKRVKQGLVLPGLEFKVMGEDGEVPWNDEDFGELWIRGPWVTTEYFRRPEANEQEFENGWLKTGDVVRVDAEGYIQIVDRAKDVIKSGGEWISSQELENAIMAHDDVSEATVIGVPHEKWQERPVAFVVAREGVDRGTLNEEVMALLAEEYPKWWLPDDVVHIDSVPKTATGKFDKKVLRAEYTDHTVEAPEEAAPEDD